MMSYIQEADQLVSLLIKDAKLPNVYVHINVSNPNSLTVEHPIQINKDSRFFDIMNTISKESGWDYELTAGAFRMSDIYGDPIILWKK